MKKLLTFLTVAALCIATVTAQNRAGDLFTVTGQVIDSLANEPVPFATVAVAFTQTPTTFVRVAATDENGKFELQIQAPGSYIMHIQSIMITTLTKPLTLTETNTRVALGIIYVQGTAQQLGEVVVAVQRPIVRVEIDKLIYDMQEDPEAKVNNTLDMLRKVPMVTVDGEDNIQLRGSSNFRIYLNGKPSNMFSGQNVSEVLKSMPANSIRNIEVITDPGARYDAEGVGGIINIITARNTLQGFQGSVLANAGTLGTVGGGTTLTSKIGKLGLTGNFNYNNSNRPWTEQSSESENFIDTLYYRDIGSTRNKSNGSFMSGRLEASYEFDTLRLLSLGINLYGSNSKGITEGMTEMFNNADVLQFGYDRYGDRKYTYGSTGANLDYQRSTRKKDENFTFSYRFSNLSNPNENFTYIKNITGALPSHIRLNQWYDNDSRTTEHAGQIDYVNPLSPKHSIETGFKYTLRQNISKVGHYYMDNREWIPVRNDYSTDFEHISNIYAAYAGYAYKAQKFGLRTGLRAEGTWQYVKYRLDESKNFDVDYSNVVPNITVSYQLKPTQQLRLGYSLRIFRPSIWYLNPYVNDTDPFNISYGNPDLKPEKSHGFNFNYSYFSPKITLNASSNYSYVNNAIEYYTFVDENDPAVKRSTSGNIGRNHRASVYMNVTWTPNRVLRLTVNGGLNYADLRSSAREQSNSGLTGNTNVMAQVTLPKDFRINANAMYMSGWIMLQGKQSGYYFYSLSANKDLLKKKMTVSLSCGNPFNKYLKMDYTTRDEYFATKYAFSQPMREARISVSYRFGSMKEAIKKVQRTITSDDVKSGGDSGSGGGAVGGQ